MNRRDFLGVAGGVTAAASMFKANPLFAERTTAFYAKGLIMASFEDPQYLRLGFPKAPGHKATMEVVPQSGRHQILDLKGASALEATAENTGKSKFVIPEVIRLQEIYGDGIRSRINECPVVI